MRDIEYRYGNDLNLESVIEFHSTLGERRPVDDRRSMTDMLRHAISWSQRIISYRHAHSATFPTSAIWRFAVRLSHQRRGIGVELHSEDP